MSLTVRNIDWGRLVAENTLYPAFKTAARDVIAGRGGVSVNDVDVDLSPGSVRVSASVQLAAAGGDDAEQKLLERLGPRRSLGDAVAARVSSIDGISAATTGDIHVEDVKLGKVLVQEARLDMRWLILGVIVTACFCCCCASCWLRNWVARPGEGQRSRTASGHDWRRSEEYYRPVRSLDGLGTTKRHEAWSSEAHKPRARGQPKLEARASETKAYGWALHQSPEEYNPTVGWSAPPTREGSVHIANEIRQDLGVHAISPLIDLGQEQAMLADPLLQTGLRGSVPRSGSSFTRQVRSASGNEGASRASSAATSFALSTHSRAASFQGQHAGQGLSHTPSSFSYQTGPVPGQAMRGTVLEPSPPHQAMRGTVLEPTPPHQPVAAAQWAMPTPTANGANRTAQMVNHLLQLPQPPSGAAAVRTGHYWNGSQSACAAPTGDVVQRMLRG